MEVIIEARGNDEEDDGGYIEQKERPEDKLGASVHCLYSQYHYHWLKNSAKVVVVQIHVQSAAARNGTNPQLIKNMSTVPLVHN